MIPPKPDMTKLLSAYIMLIFSVMTVFVMFPGINIDPSVRANFLQTWNNFAVAVVGFYIAQQIKNKGTPGE